ncbi:hypothetical protein GCM10008982_20760 [Anoxybacillus voinovskiensis]|nr:hypothetical protein GCM10008982_20760 [Anoxybacillus voinovskiensis]
MLQKRAILHTFFFLLGFSVIFIAIGFGTSVIGKLFVNYQDLIRQISALFIIFFGLVILGVFSPSFMMKDKRLVFRNKPSGYFGSILIGIGFAAGWTPCTGPILVSVIALAATKPSAAMLYMFAYVLGFAVPFFIMSFFISKLNWIKRYNAVIVKVGGVLMIIMGIMLFFDWMTKIIIFFTGLFGGFTGF